MRRFLLVVPDSAPDPAPLVLVFHGFTRSPEEIEDTSGMSALAEEHGFIVAYPGHRLPPTLAVFPGAGRSGRGLRP